MLLHIRAHLKNLSRLSGYKLFFSGNKPDQLRGEKVFLDEESIQKKIQQLKEKSQTVSYNDKNKSKKKDFMPTFTIPQVNKKVNEFRKKTNSEDIFAFSDITLQQKPTILQISGYDNEFIQVDNFQYPPSIILTPNQIINWEVQAPEELKIENFAILKCLNPIPDYVIIGVPDSTVIKNELRQKLRKIHGNIDILDLFEAISQFNTVVNDDKYCIAFLMSC